MSAHDPYTAITPSKGSPDALGARIPRWMADIPRSPEAVRVPTGWTGAAFAALGSGQSET